MGITTTIITNITTRILATEAVGKTNFPTKLSGVLRGRRKGDPNTSVLGHGDLMRVCMFQYECA